MLSLPVLRENQTILIVMLCLLAYFGLTFFVLKTLQYNKDRFNS